MSSSCSAPSQPEGHVPGQQRDACFAGRLFVQDGPPRPWWCPTAGVSGQGISLHPCHQRWQVQALLRTGMGLCLLDHGDVSPGSFKLRWELKSEPPTSPEARVRSPRASEGDRATALEGDSRAERRSSSWGWEHRGSGRDVAWPPSPQAHLGHVERGPPGCSNPCSALSAQRSGRDLSRQFQELESLSLA